MIGRSGRPYADPYLAGACLGVVLLAVFVITGPRARRLGRVRHDRRRAHPCDRARAGRRPIRTSRATSRATGPWRDWLLFEIAGVALGGFLSAWAAGRLRGEVERGPRARLPARLVLGFAGGAAMGLGAVLARGCTSGLALTGGALLSVGGLAVHDRGVRGGLPRQRPLLQPDVAMTAPWIDAAPSGPALVTAVGIGVAFGVALERAGLGSARKLVGQFYGTDLTVFKVMFSAIVVAMLGAFWLGRLGMLELSRVERARDLARAAAGRRRRVRRRAGDRRAVPGHVVRRRGERARRWGRGPARHLQRRARHRPCCSRRCAGSTRPPRAAR